MPRQFSKAAAFSGNGDPIMNGNQATNLRERGISLIFTAMTLVFIVPMVGLAIDASVANHRSVSVTAYVTAPLYFMRWLGNNNTTVSATATAVRRDVNVVVVMDRSGSLATSASCNPLKAAAITFVSKFANGR